MSLLTLYGRHIHALTGSSDRPFLGRLSDQHEVPLPERSKSLFVSSGADPVPSGFRAYLFRERPNFVVPYSDAFVLGQEMGHLEPGDIVRIDPARGGIAVLYRKSSRFNSFLVTERCDNYCVMCSQPPKARDDSWIVDELEEVIPLMSPETSEVGITGGEPALLGDRLVRLVALLKASVPRTAVHILSNGRGFAGLELARSLARVSHPDLMIGIPLYSDLPEEHDYVVQARGAFSDTIRGILNLKRFQVRVEIRFVIQADTYRRLPAFARFLTRNLLFVDHVALMGLELMGFARANLDQVWIDPTDYQEPLFDAVDELVNAGMHVSIYNHQLCVLDPRLHKFARRSISDWKNMYFDECGECGARAECGGFFASSSLRRSRGIHPIQRMPFDSRP